MKRADIRAIFPDATDEQITQMLGVVHSEIDPIRDDADRLKGELASAKKAGSEDAACWKKKAEEAQQALDDFKKDQAANASAATKKATFEAFLKESGLSDKGQAKALKYTDLASIEFGDDGKIKNADALKKSIAEEWSEYVTQAQTSGANTGNPDGAGNSTGAKALTREDIYARDEAGRYKMSAAERQKAIMDNPQLFE